MRASTVPIPEPAPLSEPKVRYLSLGTRWLIQGDYRLDAAFYADEGFEVRRILEECGSEVKRLGEVTARIFHLTESQARSNFKRIYATPGRGVPFLPARELFFFRPLARRYLSPSMEKLEECLVQSGWVLVSRSGTVGRCLLVGARLARFACSDDVLRVIPKDTLPGYLYAFLASRFGRVLATRDKYGAVVNHLEARHLANIPIPLLPPAREQEIHEKITTAYRLRDEANDLLDQADKLLHAELGLPRFDESQMPYIKGQPSESEGRMLKAFTVKASELAERLDVSYHLPIVKTCIAQMQKGGYSLVQLGNVAQPYVAPRFRRIYVKPEHGVPFLQGSHIPMMKPYDLKYLSQRAHADLSPWLIEEGWVLVTCSGTIGRVALVPNALNGWAASQHIERIIPHSQRAHAGYLAAFLMTPYGQYQLSSKIYGGVVDELTEDDTAAVWLPDAPLGVQQRIGMHVVQAFEKKEAANAIERGAITQLEDILTQKNV